MSLVGFRLAFADAVSFELPSGSSVRVASLRSHEGGALKGVTVSRDWLMHHQSDDRS